MPEFIPQDFVNKKLDEAISAAYGWKSDLGDDKILEMLVPLNLWKAKL